MSNKSDQLRSRLPKLAEELSLAVGEAVRAIRHARASDKDAGEVHQAWRKGLSDALLMLRDAEQAHERFRKWLMESAEELVDKPRGITVEDRDALMEMLAGAEAGTAARCAGDGVRRS